MTKIYIKKPGWLPGVQSLIGINEEKDLFLSLSLYFFNSSKDLFNCLYYTKFYNSALSYLGVKATVSQY